MDGTLHATSTATVYRLGTGASGTALVEFTDTFTLTSTSLAFGTPVELLFELDLSYSLGGNCTDSSYVYAGVVDNNGAIELLQDASCDTSDSTYHRLAQHSIGEEFPVSMFLYAITGATQGSAFADAGNSLGIVVTPLGDFTFTTASGNEYQRVAAAPEPATLALLGAGFALLVLRRSRCGSIDSER